MFAESQSDHKPDGFQLDPDDYAIPSADLLHDWFVEHGDDPDEGDPTQWPAWTDGWLFSAVSDQDFLTADGCPLKASKFDPLPSDDDEPIPF